MHNIRQTRAEIDLDSLNHNFTIVRRLIGERCKILGVVKANAYGHGAIEVAKELVSAKVDMLGVAIVEEAIELRKAGINIPILILAGLLESQIEDIVDYNLTQTIYTSSLAVALSNWAVKKGRQVTVHLKVDTGMSRVGVSPEDVLSFVREINKLPNLRIEGIFTHLSVADDPNQDNKNFTIDQINTFRKIISLLEEHNFYIPLKHAANSAAIIGYPESYFDMVRPGIMLYGANPSLNFSQDISLKPVMSLKTKIVYLKTVSADKSISYGRTFRTKRESKIATILIGYDDGYSRLLSNKVEVLINGEKAPVVGTICMDMCMTDVTEIEKVDIEDDVILFGQDDNNKGLLITVDELAKKLNTVSYEILCCIGRRVPRIYKKSGKVVSVVDYLMNDYHCLKD
ncbi:MAG: alanine racemase [bacterium]